MTHPSPLSQHLASAFAAAAAEGWSGAPGAAAASPVPRAAAPARTHRWRRRRAVDRVLATVLFTDIVGSTAKAVQLGDRAWGDVLAAHDRAVRAIVSRHGGRLVKLTGDGALAAFDRPGRAIAAACAIRTAAHALGLQLRAGLHAGECERLGRDLGGIVVHTGARVAAGAHPGQIRVTRTVADLVAGSPVAFTACGDEELRGVPGRWELYAVAG